MTRRLRLNVCSVSTVVVTVCAPPLFSIFLLEISLNIPVCTPAFLEQSVVKDYHRRVRTIIRVMVEFFVGHGRDFKTDVKVADNRGGPNLSHKGDTKKGRTKRRGKGLLD